MNKKEENSKNIDRILSEALLFGVHGEENLRKEAEFLKPVVERMYLHPIETMVEIARGSYTRDRKVEYEWTVSKKAFDDFFDLVVAVLTSPKDCFKCKHLGCNKTSEWCGHKPKGKFNNAKECEYLIFIDWYLRYILEPGYLIKQ